MTTTFAEPDDLQQAGEECQSCKSFWVYQHLPPRKLVALGVLTENKGIPIVVCPHCDSDAILRLHND